ncbi:MAG: nucleotidyltransferase domain-containing protein [Nitrososphaerota archaeon]
MPKKYSGSVKVFFPKFNREKVVEEVYRCVRVLCERLALEKVILFGSYAKGRYTVASDIGLLIVFDDEKIGG